MKIKVLYVNDKNSWSSNKEAQFRVHHMKNQLWQGKWWFSMKQLILWETVKIARDKPASHSCISNAVWGGKSTLVANHVGDQPDGLTCWDWSVESRNQFRGQLGHQIDVQTSTCHCDLKINYNNRIQN